MNPLSAWTYHRRHKRHAALLLSLSIVVTIGLYSLVALVWAVFVEQPRASYMALSKFSIVTPWSAADGPEPGVIDRIRTNPDVARVIPTTLIRVQIPGIMPGESLQFDLLGLLEEDVAYILERSGATLKHGRLPAAGTNGILPPPKGWLKGLRALLDRYGVLLICDEVMAGFGRTGKMFAFEHGDIVPDIVTMAKGLTSSYLPLGAMGVSDRIADHFRENVFWGGLTYNSHPMGCAAALAVIDVIIDEGLVDNAAKMQAVMRGHMDRLQAKHPSMKEGRCIGLFGMIDLQKNAAGARMAPYNGTSEAMVALGKFFRQEGLFTFIRWGSFMNNPPLCITEAQLAEGFEIVDRGLDITDTFVGV